MIPQCYIKTAYYAAGRSKSFKNLFYKILITTIALSSHTIKIKTNDVVPIHTQLVRVSTPIQSVCSLVRS